MATDANGNVAITIKLVGGNDPTGGEDDEASGVVTAVTAHSLTIDTGDEKMTFEADSDVLADIQVDDQVDVTYYEDGGTLVADDVSLVDDGQEDDTVTGTVTQVRGDGLTIQVDGEGPMSFGADPVVDVSYYQDDDGSLVADDVEPATPGGPDDSNDSNDE
jgi:hypothetical protein